MKLVFRPIRPDEVEREITQREQFDSDDVGLLEALVRESHQNSLDAVDTAAGRTVRTRVSFHVPSRDDVEFLDKTFRDLPEHLTACGLSGDPSWRTGRFLVIEDFGTTGLGGAWETKDDRPWSDFWRRVGTSHKGGQQGGRWGLGKLVFSSASGIRSFFGLTVRNDDTPREPLLMGQAVLSVHRDTTGKEFDAHGFFCEPGPEGIQLPIRGQDAEQFRKATGISRTLEPGLSVVIPVVRMDLSATALVRELLKNYFFPILTGKLVCEVDGIMLDASTFDSVAKEHGGALLQGDRIVPFIRDIREALDKSAPTLVLADGALKDLGSAIPPETLRETREAFSKRELIHVKALLVLKHRKKGLCKTHIDVGSSRVDLQACKLEYSIVSPK